MKVARFENENEDVFQFPIRLKIKNAAQVGIYRSLKFIFYRKRRRLGLAKQSKVVRNHNFHVFQNQPGR